MTRPTRPETQTQGAAPRAGGQRRRWPFLAVALTAAAALGHPGEGQAADPPAGASRPRQVATAHARHPREKTFLKRQWGVEVMHVRQAAAGYMLEFRYKVLDAEKAKPLFERRVKPVLVDDASGARLVVPTPAKTGALRNSNAPVQGRVYWMLFANPGRLVQPGQTVAVEVGAFRADGLVVQ